MNQPHEPKYRSVAGTLRQRIAEGKLPVGAALPTMKELVREFDVSLMTVFRAVQLLREEGLAGRAPSRRGLVVIPCAPERNATVACLLRPCRPRDDYDNFMFDTIQGIRQALSQREYRLIYHGLDETEYERRIVELVEREEVCAVLMDQNTPLSVIRRIAKLPVPAGLFNREVTLPNVSSVLPDYGRMARESVRLLRERGYERLGFYKMPLDEAAWDEAKTAAAFPIVAMRQGFLEATRDCGVAPVNVFLMRELAPQDDPLEPASYGLHRWKGLNWRPTGILADSDALATDLIAAIGRTDLTLGKDIGVIGCYDLEVGRRRARPPSTWKVDRCTVGATAVRELLTRVERPGNPPSTIKIAMEWLDRGTA